MNNLRVNNVQVKKEKVLEKYRKINKSIDYCETSILVNDYSKIVIEMEKYFELNEPVMLGAILNLADLYFYSGNYKEAIKYFEKVKEKLSNDESLLFFEILEINIDLIIGYQNINRYDNVNQIEKENRNLLKNNIEKNFFDLFCVSKVNKNIYNEFLNLMNKLKKINQIINLGGNEKKGQVGFLTISGEKVPVFNWELQNLLQEGIKGKKVNKIILELIVEEHIERELFKAFLNFDNLAYEVFWGNFKSFKGLGEIINIERSNLYSCFPGRPILIEVI